MGRPYVPPVDHVCEECGETFLGFVRDKRRFCGYVCSGRANQRKHKDSFRGPNNPRWNGGLSEWDGRTLIICRDYSWIFYYRGVMEAHLGRELRDDEIVHHVNGDPSDDRIENLQVVTRSEHIGLHRDDLLAARGLERVKAVRKGKVAA